MLHSPLTTAVHHALKLAESRLHHPPNILLAALTEALSPTRRSVSSMRPPISSSPRHPHSANTTSLPYQPADSLLERHPSRAGAEPGVNPHHESSFKKNSHFKQDCVIDVIDYDSDGASFERLGNADFIKMINLSYEKGTKGDPDHHPKAVRWINIGGIDWDVLSAITLRYHIHSLALEDVLQEQGDIQSKADYYPDHLFVRALCHSVSPQDDLEAPHHQTGSDLRCHFHHRSGSAPPPYKTSTSPRVTEGGGFSNQKADIELGDNNSIKHTYNQGSKNIPSSSTVPFDRSYPQKPPASANQELKHRLSLPWLHSSEIGARSTGLSGWWRSSDQQQILKLRALTIGDRVNVRHEPLSIFLFRDGTVISIVPTPDLNFTAPIAERLQHAQSVLRTSEDASLLLQALLDLVVDRILEVIDEYQMKIHKIEHDIMLSPSMDSVRSLHVLSGDLIMHKLTLEPIKTMIYNLRRYDTDRCIAMANHFKADADSSSSNGSDSDLGAGNYKQSQSNHTDEDGESHQPPADVTPGLARERLKAKRLKVQKNRKKREAEKAEKLRWERSQRYGPGGVPKGYLSYTSKVYLGDVCDHMGFALTRLDMFAGVSENLIDYAFNMASYRMNQAMNRLTVVTIIFLPLTLLTGYFGMNFSPFLGLEGHTEILFWKIAAVVMAIVVPLFMFHDLKHLAKYVSRRWKAGRAVKGMR